MEDTTTPKRRAPRRQAADNTPKLSEYGNVQPQALDFEEAVLGALMIDSDAMGRLAPDALPAGMFVAGDVHSDIKMQIATAVGTGCAAGMDAIAYLNKLQ